MTPRTLATFNSEGFISTAYEVSPGGMCYVMSDYDVDVDGSLPNIYRDPYYQSDTTLHYEGKALNTDVDQWFVLPPSVIIPVKGMVLGCYGELLNLITNEISPFVVGDVGPLKKIGEGSRKLAKNVHIDPDPNIGGMDGPHCLVRWWPGKAASINGRQYKLQPYK